MCRDELKKRIFWEIPHCLMRGFPLPIIAIVLIFACASMSISWADTGIPNWVRNNAKWWAEGAISDTDFVQGIQFLINQKVIQIPNLPTSSAANSNKIPDWIKKNAGWWADGQISDNDFVSGIQYMIRSGIIVIDLKMEITSEAFENNGIIPEEYTCDGSDTSPQISISNVPKTAKSLALIMDDPDAPMGTFVHWLVWNISPDKSSMAKGEDIKETQGTTGFGKEGYGGPCPPGGTHRYFFKVYALDTMLELEHGSSKSALEKAMDGHIIEKAELVGKYSRG